ncbi:ATP-binding cassette domain-containing protein [Dactylosporangium matsuzakiense]|uniref:ABC transporter n=1 Tax=Dactylosporangium matsuzakiense TaxID=53360 RepID=A0A9W6KH09_9ACTN|nr:ATP-binding cassette domain-containing protein [Dactylosporangium matsuzakiense]UWZ47306.1 ATP-binding cassette domain-containing protein [Dactylosporangium matsuzakiense]GLL01358.1 ABC transporter [Dactylosporangium matsuzakiense]
MIKTKGLKKSYKTRAKRQTTEVEAVKGIDLDVAEGEIFGFLGPNGAGKTTTLRMLATLIPMDDGEATIAGANLRTEAGNVRRAIGFVAQGGSTSDDVSAREELILQARMYGMGRAEAAARAAEVIESFELTEFADRKCKTYSGGQRRRLDIALGIIHRPQVLFLDEPTTGLDPQSRAHMWDEVRRLRAEGMTVFITTHYLDEADALCDRISIIDHGEIVAEGTPDALKREISGDVVTVGVADDLAEKAAEVLKGQEFAREVDLRDDGELRLTVESGDTAIPQIMRTLDGAGVALTTIELHRPTLDDVFLTKTGRSLRD